MRRSYRDCFLLELGVPVLPVVSALLLATLEGKLPEGRAGTLSALSSPISPAAHGRPFEYLPNE